MAQPPRSLAIRLPLEWSCDADSLNTLWSVFNFTFHINGNQVDIRERSQEDVNVHSIHDATVDYNEGRCTLHSGFVSADSVTRIWQGLVWRDAIHRYYLQDDEDIYPSIVATKTPRVNTLPPLKSSGTEILLIAGIGTSRAPPTFMNFAP